MTRLRGALKDIGCAKRCTELRGKETEIAEVN
jgi:hypothetical protein